MDFFSRSAAPGAVTASIAALLLCACAGPRVAVEAQETFDSASTYSRTYAALEAPTCEAARRALLSQGYVINAATSDRVRGRKSFQPTPMRTRRSSSPWSAPARGTRAGARSPS